MLKMFLRVQIIIIGMVILTGNAYADTVMEYADSVTRAVVQSITDDAGKDVYKSSPSVKVENQKKHISRVIPPEICAELDAVITEQCITGPMKYLTSSALGGRGAGTEYARKTAEYLADQLNSYGVEPAGDHGTYFQKFTFPTAFSSFPSTGAGCNVLGVIPGSDPQLKKRYLILSAHYDHLGAKFSDSGKLLNYYPGADDNASSVSILLSVAKAIKKLNYPVKHSILFLFFDAEECILQGSRYWVEHPTVKSENVELAINYDMNGHLKKETGLFLFGTFTCGHGEKHNRSQGINKPSRETELSGERQKTRNKNISDLPIMRTGTHEKTVLLPGKTVRTYFNQAWETLNAEDSFPIYFPWQVMLPSDNISFIRKGIPAILVITGVPETYHTTHDTLESVNITGMVQIARFSARSVLIMANELDITDFYADWKSVPVKGSGVNPEVLQKAFIKIIPQ